VRTTASQTITFGGQAKTSLALTGYGESVWISCDGSGYHVDAHASPLMKDGLPFVSITDRLSSPPVSPTGGARYIINGTPTGVWSTLGFVEKQIAESDGNGSWFAYTPGDGWLAYVADEDLLTQYRSGSTAWVDLTNVTAPTSSNLKLMIVEHRETNGTDAGTGTNNAWTDRTLNTAVANTIPGASLSSNQITLPVGKYLVSYSQVFESTVLVAGAGAIMEATQRIQAGTAVFSATPVRGLNGRFGGIWTGSGVGVNASDTYAPLDICYLDVTTAGTLTLQYYKSGGTLGRANSESSGASEIYARVQILDLSSLQGPRGEQGPEWRSLIVTDTPHNVDPTSGYFSDYEGLAAVELVLSQAEVQAFDESGGWRSAFSIEHQDSDDTNYSTGPYQTISDGLRAGTFGKQSGGVYQPQYKDLVGLSSAAIGRIEWTDRGVSGIATEAIQHGSGIASNEFAVLNPAAAANQSVSMAAVQAIVSGKKAAADASHFVRAVLATNVGKLATSAFEAVSAGTGGDNGRFAYLLKGDLSTVSTAAILMPASASGDVGTRIIYDTNDYTEYIRASNIYTWYIGGGGKLALAVDALYPLDSNLKLGVSGAGYNGVYVGSGTGLYVGGTKVVGNQGAAVADASGGATIDTEARTAINTLLARLRAHGLIAT
jgi:hypothetical protein